MPVKSGIAGPWLRVQAGMLKVPLTRRGRWWLFAASLLLLVPALVWLAMRVEPVRHASARSLRLAVGAPEPPPMLPDAWVPTLGAEPEAPVLPPRRPAGLDGVSFMLLLGADNRSDKIVGRTDTMIVAAFRHDDGKVAAFSLPRDLWVELPNVGELHAQGHDHARISSVVRVGEVRLGAGQGIPLLRRTLFEQLGIEIDRFASVDFAGFVALVDELGGIEVDVQCPIMDCFWTNGTDQPCEMLTVEAGRTHMDGATALKFVRSRHGTGDRDRTRRQQAVMLAFANKARDRGLRGLPELWRRAQPFVTTDLEGDDAIYYASFALERALSEVGGFSITHPMVARHVTPDDKHVMLLDRDAFEAALGRMFDAELPALREREQCPAADAAL
jgi:LCP family protein required for cell wall assembly